MKKLIDYMLIACTATFFLALYVIFFPIWHWLKQENEIPLPEYRGPFPECKEHEL